MTRATSADSRAEAMTAANVAAVLVPMAVSIYVGVLAYAYYFHRWGIARHHLESAWMWLVAVLLTCALSSVPLAVASSERFAMPPA